MYIESQIKGAKVWFIIGYFLWKLSKFTLCLCWKCISFWPQIQADSLHNAQKNYMQFCLFSCKKCFCMLCLWTHPLDLRDHLLCHQLVNIERMCLARQWLTLTLTSEAAVCNLMVNNQTTLISFFYVHEIHISNSIFGLSYNEQRFYPTFLQFWVSS